MAGLGRGTMFIQEADREISHLASKLFTHFCQLLDAEKLNDLFDVAGSAHQLGIMLNQDNLLLSSITLNQYYQLLEMSAPLLQKHDFFLKLGQLFDISDAGLLGYASLSVENLRQSWRITSQNYSLFPHPLTAEQIINNNEVSFRIKQRNSFIMHSIYLHEEWLSSTWKWMRMRLSDVDSDQDLTVKLAYPAPKYHESYGGVFPGKIMFDQPHTALSFPEYWYDMPFSTANPATAEICLQQCSLIMSQLDQQTDLVDRVRRLLLLPPQREFPTLEDIAEQLHLPVHTFHRQLKKSGLNYRHIVNEVRMELAKDYLEKTNLPLQEIAYLLGYEHPANFYRAFKNWLGYTPTGYRQKG